MQKVGAECVCREISRRLALQSQSALARDLGLGSGGQALISKVARGVHISPASELRIARAMGIAPPPRIEVDPCPDCGSVHTGRCNGRAVEVRPVRKTRPFTRWADAPTKQLAAAIINRQEYP